MRDAKLFTFTAEFEIVSFGPKIGSEMAGNCNASDEKTCRKLASSAIQKCGFWVIFGTFKIKGPPLKKKKKQKSIRRFLLG